MNNITLCNLFGVIRINVELVVHRFSTVKDACNGSFVTFPCCVPATKWTVTGSDLRVMIGKRATLVVIEVGEG